MKRICVKGQRTNKTCMHISRSHNFTSLIDRIKKKINRHSQASKQANSQTHSSVYKSCSCNYEYQLSVAVTIYSSLLMCINHIFVSLSTRPHWQLLYSDAFNDRPECAFRLTTYIDVIECIAEKVDRRIQFNDFKFIVTIFQSNRSIVFIQITGLQCAREMLCTEHETSE